MANSLDLKIMEIASRIRNLRELEGISVEEMAKRTGVSAAEYTECEEGRSDLNFAFLYSCAAALGIDVTELIEGASPKLTAYTVTRNGAGQRIEQAHGMVYYNLASSFKRRTAEPLRVLAMYSKEAQDKPIEVTSHEGQELDIIISGSLKIQIGDHIEILSEGDSIYYDSSAPHGMIATGGQDCAFYAIVLDPAGAAQGSAGDIFHIGEHITENVYPEKTAETEHRVWENFVIPTEDSQGRLQSIAFKNENSFNFAFDVVDAIAAKSPDKLAMMHVGRDKKETRLTFMDVSKMSCRAANYFKSLGIRRGDRVMLVLRRNYQFWITMIALHRIGAIAIPATDQLLKKDFDYRFRAAGISAVVISNDAPTAVLGAEEAMAEYDGITAKILTSGHREGWHDFDEEMPMFRSTFERTEDSPCGDDYMLMYFTSGTSGYPKIAAHNYKYPLGHFITAKYWQCVVPDGLHLTISDTGWAKAAWGKIYGQWLCEAGLFIYDFDRFDANDILPMFKKYGITTFCAPPTMYRFLIKEDLSRFDLSSIKHATIAGEALNPEVFHQFKKATGLSVMEGFGQTESTVIVGNLFGMTPKIGSMGKPSPLY
ncbi:MAG: AMP-binding protein, partial [Oscillospiraceae bacterium]|nr:AMP-binding protein [Oscillospiraceae bacterium]